MTPMNITSQNDAAELELVRAALADDYDVLEELGRGGMAIVYRAMERDLHREVALKVLPFAVAFNTDIVERFQREARTAAQLEHPHIIPIYRVGRHGQVIYFVMKYLRGESLSSLIERRGVLTVAEVRRILVEAGSALGYASERGVVHRDVKPDNIMLDVGDRCVVTDFGIARSLADGKLTAAGMTLGTPRYMSPEQARAQEVDGRSDLYSLGCVAYECLVGRPPFAGPDPMATLLAHISTPVPRPQLRMDEEHDLYDVIERMLAKEPDDRFQTAEELLAALGEVARRSSGATAVAAPQRRPLTPTRAAPAVGEPGAASTAQTGATADSEASLRLHRALDAGIRAAEVQKQVLGAGLTKVKAFTRKHRPGAEAAVRTGLAHSARGARTGYEQSARGARTALEYSAHAADRIRQVPPRQWGMIAVALLMITGVYYSLHFAIAHRSRCPAVAAPATDAATGSAQPQSTLALLLDPVANRSTGSKLPVYYDVCGLEADTPFRTNVSVTRNTSGLRRIFGEGVKPVTASYEDNARGPALRRHRSLSLDELPAGTYTLAVAITDNRGRQRTRAVEFQVTD
jgi:hypothetical protein